MWCKDNSLLDKQGLECHRDLDTLKKIAKCLDNMCSDKYHSSFPGIKRDIERIEHKLNYLLAKKSEYGLYQIKHQITGIAKRIKHCLGKIDKIDNIVTTSGIVVNDVKKTVSKIENHITDPAFGLKEIKLEIRGIEKQLKQVDDAVCDPGYGLKEIKCGVHEIEKQLKEIDDAVYDPGYGLKEIKQQTKEIDRKLDNLNHKPTLLTTGPLFVGFSGAGVVVIHLKAQNYTNSPQSITFTVHKLDNNSPFTENKTDITLDLEPLCAEFAEVTLDEYVENLEIRAHLSSSDVFIYAAIIDATDPADISVKKDVLHSEWAALENNCYSSS